MNLHNLYATNPIGKQEITIPITNEKELKGVWIEGAQIGKTLVVTTGVHGCEYVGIQAVRELIQEISTNQLRGNIFLIPLVNESGFYQGAKQIVPEDGKNLNRCFPGKEDGTLSEQIAFAIERICYKKADFLVDLHGGDVNETMTPLVFFPVAAGKEMEEITREATSYLSLSYRIQSRAKNGLYSYATQCNIPAILIERGGAGKWSKQEVEQCKQNIYELMSYLEILPKEEPIKNAIELDSVCYEETEQQGLWYCYKEAGQRVKKGELLGELLSYDGTLHKKYEAKFDGVVLYFTHALGVNKGDALIAYGKL